MSASAQPAAASAPRCSRATCRNARAAGLTALKATIRCDNTGGLAYYARIGFRDYDANPGFALSDGRVVGQTHRRFDL